MRLVVNNGIILFIRGLSRMSAMAILELVINQTYFGNLVINRFHYIQSGTPAAVTPSFGLIAATGFLNSTLSGLNFESGSLARQWQTWVNEQVSFVSAYSRNLYSVSDFYETPYPSGVQGDIAQDALSPVMAFGLQTNRVRTDIRRGSKRFVGVGEGQTGSGGSLDSTTAAALDVLAGLMSDTLTYDDEGNTLTYVPCVLGLEKYTAPSGKDAYRPYGTEVEQLDHVAAGVLWSVMPKLRSQVSRQYGRGA